MPRTRTPRKPKTPPPAASNGNGTHAPRSDVKDLSELFAQKTAVITIYDPRDDGLPVRRDTGYRFEVAPRWSPEAQEIIERYSDQLKRTDDGKIDATDPKLAEVVLEQVVVLTKRFWQEPDSPDGIILEGELLTPSPENTRTLLKHDALDWLFADLIDAIRDRGRFFGARPKTA